MAKRGGFDRTFFESLGKDVEDAAKKVLEEGAIEVVEEAKSRLREHIFTTVADTGRKSRSTGKLINSIHYIKQNKGRRIRIVADAKDDDGEQYGQFVEFSPRINKPFMYPALDAHRAEIRQKIIDAIRGAVHKHAKR